MQGEGKTLLPFLLANTLFSLFKIPLTRTISRLTVYSLMHLGCIKETEKFSNWVEQLFFDMEIGGGLKLMYTVAGQKEMDEQVFAPPWRI